MINRNPLEATLVGSNFDSGCLYIARIINPQTNDDYILKNSINEIIAFEDRYDAIDYAKKYIRKRFYIEYFRVYSEPIFRLEAFRIPLQIIRRKVKR